MVKTALPSPDIDFEEGAFIVNSEDVSNLQNDIDSQISSILSEFGTDKGGVDFFLSVFRVVKDQGELAWLFRCTPAELPIMERLRDEYDGGKFEVRIYKNKKIYKRINISVESPKKPKELPPQKNDMAEILKVMAEQQAASFNQLKETLMQLVGKPATPQPSQMDMMMAMVTMMKGMKDVVGVQNAPIESHSAEKLMDMFIRGMEAGKESGGGSGSSMVDVLRDAVKALPSLSQLSAMQPPRFPVPEKPVHQNLQVNNPPPVENTEQGKDENMNLQEIAIRQYIGLLVKKAEKSSDPGLYAELVLDEVPEDIVNQYLMRDDLVELLGKMDSRVLQHREWFSQLRDEIHDLLTAPEDPDDNTLNESTSSHHPTDHSLGSGGDTPDA